MSIDDFLGHKPSGGGNSSYLRGWKKRNPPHIDVWLHTGVVPVPLWQHNVPRVFEKTIEGSDSKEMVVFGSSWNCWEPEDVLKKQRYVDKQTGQRVEMPRQCPVCRLVENVREHYADGKLNFCDTLFRFVGTDPTKAQKLTVGGILSRYGRDDLTLAEKEAMAKAKIDPREAWRETLWAKCNYLFVVVEEGKTSDGIQIAVETTQIGQVVQEMIAAQREALGLVEGDPLQNPYAIRWKYNANAELSKKYNAIAMQKIPLTPEVEKLIVDTPVPDLSNVVRHGDVALLRANLEGHATEKAKNVLDFEWIFGPAEKAAAKAAAQQPAQQEDAQQADAGEDPPWDAEERPKTRAPEVPAEEPKAKAAAKEPAKEPKKRSRKKKEEPKPEPKPEPQEFGDPCEECGASMLATDTKCGNCGAEYDMQPVESVAPAAAEDDFEF